MAILHQKAVLIAADRTKNLVTQIAVLQKVTLLHEAVVLLEVVVQEAAEALQEVVVVQGEDNDLL